MFTGCQFLEGALWRAAGYILNWLKNRTVTVHVRFIVMISPLHYTDSYGCAQPASFHWKTNGQRPKQVNKHPDTN